MKALNMVEKLASADSKKGPKVEATALETEEGIGWSKEVIDEIEWRLDDARKDLINVAKQNSQWRSLVQTVFIILATISVGLVWYKVNSISQKGMF